MRSADVGVVGLGAVGSAAAWQLASRGARVVAFDPHGVAHARGSSHGESRVIRKAYFEHPDYVPLLERAYALWDELAAESGRELFVRCGMLLVGPADGAVIDGVRRARAVHGVPLEDLDARSARERFDGFAFPDELAVAFERDAGLLRVEECVREQCAAARRRGATLVTDARVIGFTSSRAGVEVHTSSEPWSMGCLVAAAGAWSGRLLSELGLPLEVRRKVQLWLEAEPGAYRVENGSPVFGFHVSAADKPAFFYGFPALEPGVIKIAEHTGGDPIEDPDRLERALGAGDARRVLDFAVRHLPRARARVVRHAACMYTMTPDEHFIVGLHPGAPRVAFAAGMSGHGFKLAPILGKALADLALDGRTDERVELFSPERFGG
jgi:sarcosine oxidase